MSEAADIGNQLRQAREAQGLSVAQAADSLRVDAVVIESLEAGRFFALGPPVFARGYLRHYAELLGEPLEAVLDRYQALHESSASPDIAAVPHLPPKSGARRARWPLVIVAIALIVAVVVWWAMGVKTA